MPDPDLEAWVEALALRHMADLTFAEVRRGLQALSSVYVERRGRIADGAALDGAGKRAAFALFYGPLHFLLVRHAAQALDAGTPPPARIVDLGCGTGAAGAALALAAAASPTIEGVDTSAWALEEARHTWKTLGLRGRTRRDKLEAAAHAGRRDLLVAAFAANGLDPGARGRLRDRLLAAAAVGAGVLVVEPLSLRAVPWWEEWSAAFIAGGGRADTWRFPSDLPELLVRLDHAAGLDHRELGARTLWIRSGTTEPEPRPARG